ncbi:MAG TPA: hypothetical protein VKB89_20510 [Xanthobacteraceae bacterium]|nr:hypothetical protein [Xanthobacteraceae bacterium]
MNEQRALIERLAERGQDTKLAEVLLHTMRISLDRMHEHRVMIERAIATGKK